MSTDPKKIPTSTGMELVTTGLLNITVKTWNTIALSIVNKDVVGAQFSASALAVANVLSTTGVSVTCHLGAHVVLANGDVTNKHTIGKIKTIKKGVKKLKKKFQAEVVSCERIQKDMEGIRDNCELCANGQDMVHAATEVTSRTTTLCAAANTVAQQAYDVTQQLMKVQGTANKSLGRLTRAAQNAQENLGTLNQVVETSNDTYAQWHEDGEIKTILTNLHIW